MREFGPGAPGAEHDANGQSVGLLRRIMRSLYSNPAAMLSLTFLVLLTIIAVAAPHVPIQDPNRPNLGTRLAPPSADHWLGTDHYGRDVFSRTVWGARVSLTVGILAVALGAAFGILLGLVAGFLGGVVDTLVSRLIDILLAFPLLLLALVLIAVLGSSITNVIIATGISTIPQFARVVRGAVLAIREREFVQACTALGAGKSRTIFRHILPNVSAPIIVMATVYTATVIILEANLGFLGFGVQPPEASWGSIVNDGRRYLAQAPWVSIVPSAAIFIAVLSLNIFGDGLRDALDPRLR